MSIEKLETLYTQMPMLSLMDSGRAEDKERPITQSNISSRARMIRMNSCASRLLKRVQPE